MSASLDDTVRMVSRSLIESGEAMRLGLQRIQELETALNRMVLAHENTLSDSDGRWPQKDAGCPDCTSGTVPDNRNTGRCAYHTAKVLLGQL